MMTTGAGVRSIADIVMTADRCRKPDDGDRRADAWIAEPVDPAEDAEEEDEGRRRRESQVGDGSLIAAGFILQGGVDGRGEVVALGALGDLLPQHDLDRRGQPLARGVFDIGHRCSPRASAGEGRHRRMGARTTPGVGGRRRQE
jgi:hypothetical protein